MLKYVRSCNEEKACQKVDTACRPFTILMLIKGYIQLHCAIQFGELSENVTDIFSLPSTYGQA
jgi:hypothetical protein